MAKINNDKKFFKTIFKFTESEKTDRTMTEFPNKIENQIDKVLQKYGIEKYSILKRLFKEFRAFTNEIIKRMHMSEKFGDYCSTLEYTYMVELYFLLDECILNNYIIIEILKEITKQVKECKKELGRIIESMKDANETIMCLEQFLIDCYGMRAFIVED